MDNKSQIKTIFLVFLLAIALAIGVYAYSVGLTVNQHPASNSWTTSRNLYVNFTPTITDYSNFVNANGGCNITAWAVNLTADWPTANTFIVNQSVLNVVNGTTIQFNITGLFDSSTTGWNYYFSMYNMSGDNNCGLNYTKTSSIYSIKVDTIKPIVTMDRPLANEEFTDDEIYFNFTAFEINPTFCYLYLNLSDSNGLENFNLTYTWNYLNGSVEEANIPNVASGWNNYFIKCFDLAGNVDQTVNRSFFIDDTSPTITTITTNNSWSKTKATIIKANVTDTNLQSCVLWLNWTAGQQGVLQMNITNTTMTSGVDVSFSPNLADTTYPIPYYYNITCNDTSGYSIGLSGRAINIDTVYPSVVYMKTISGTTSTDHTPTINYTNSTVTGIALPDTNFLTHSITFYETDGTFYAQTNDTNYTTFQITLGNYLVSDTNYTYNITTWDRAGNKNDSGTYNKSQSYVTDSTCWNLSKGYNYCGNLKDGYTSLSSIGVESGASYVYSWNKSAWITHTVGSSTNAEYNLTRGKVAVIYLSSAHEWNDRIWNTNSTTIDYNFSGYAYHLISVDMNKTEVNMTNLEFSLNRGIQAAAYQNSTQYITYINNSALWTGEDQFKSFRLFKSFNEGVKIDYGGAMWIYNANYSITGGDVYWNKTLGGYG